MENVNPTFRQIINDFPNVYFTIPLWKLGLATLMWSVTMVMLGFVFWNQVNK